MQFLGWGTTITIAVIPTAMPQNLPTSILIAAMVTIMAIIATDPWRLRLLNPKRI
ncbi:hypothetical protein [Bremerella sp. P1]|uniref:hypothetical protein n=1 Tax=Bremerella sp. P1 TaxID=3026424 RepID=UPI00236774BF|nr:hypothetical protein [Bremerella sp. P1]WDI42501.1 hypothetical protein PSR63_00900 [Bremerella sp. P1]